MAGVDYRVTDGGDHQLVVVVDGAYVPFVTLSGDRVAALVENAENRGDTDKPKRQSRAKAESE